MYKSIFELGKAALLKAENYNFGGQPETETRMEYADRRFNQGLLLGEYYAVRGILWDAALEGNNDARLLHSALCQLQNELMVKELQVAA